MKNNILEVGFKTRFKKGQNVGDKNYNWVGGVIKHSAGYLLETCPNHPSAIAHGYVLQHRLVMEKKVGRYLNKNEVVHHINGIRDDNRIENLVLCSKNNHLSKHRKLKRFEKNNIPTPRFSGEVIAVYNKDKKITRTRRLECSRCIKCHVLYWKALDNKNKGYCLKCGIRIGRPRNDNPTGKGAVLPAPKVEVKNK